MCRTQTDIETTLRSEISGVGFHPILEGQREGQGRGLPTRAWDWCGPVCWKLDYRGTAGVCQLGQNSSGFSILLPPTLLPMYPIGKELVSADVSGIIQNLCSSIWSEQSKRRVWRTMGPAQWPLDSFKFIDSRISMLAMQRSADPGLSPGCVTHWPQEVTQPLRASVSLSEKEPVGSWSRKIKNWWPAWATQWNPPSPTPPL